MSAGLRVASVRLARAEVTFFVEARDADGDAIQEYPLRFAVRGKAVRELGLLLAEADAQAEAIRQQLLGTPGAPIAPRDTGA